MANFTINGPIVWKVAAPGVVTSVTTRVTFGESGYCAKCRRRQVYAWCSQCSANLCALCSWTVSVPRPWTKGIVDERCRECADK